MARYFRLDDIKLKPKEPIIYPSKPNRYFCILCDRYHLIYSNIGNEHRDYKVTQSY